MCALVPLLRLRWCACASSRSRFDGAFSLRIRGVSLRFFSSSSSSSSTWPVGIRQQVPLRAFLEQSESLRASVCWRSRGSRGREGSVTSSNANEQVETSGSSDHEPGMLDEERWESLVHRAQSTLQTRARLDTLRQERKQIAEHVRRAAMSDANREREEYLLRGREMKEEISRLESSVFAEEALLQQEILSLPNLIHPNTPLGDESAARIVFAHGYTPSLDDPLGSHPAKQSVDHILITDECDLVDFEAGAIVSGSRFCYLKNELVFLELGLVSWALNRLNAHGFTLYMTPELVRRQAVEGCGFMPRRADGLLHVEARSEGENTSGFDGQTYMVQGHDLCLTATAEIPLAGLFVNRILPFDRFPYLVGGFSHCFREEVGHKGSTSRGLYRVHQFSKVEMFSVCLPETSEEMHERLLSIEIELFKELGLSFRVLEMPSEELGAPAYRKFDIEAWMPGRQSFGEISSCSNCTDYQARRLGIRFRRENGVTELAHTLNATAIAVPRMIISLLETHRRDDGVVVLPDCLHGFLPPHARTISPRRSS